MHVRGPFESSWTRPALRRIQLAALAAAGLFASQALAGGGPENLFLVVNSTSADSIAVANAFVASRGVPAINVFMLPWAGYKEATTLTRFRDEILARVLRGIDSRRLAPQIDMIVYSSDFPWRIDYREVLYPDIARQDTFPSGSLTGMTMLYGAVQSGVPAWLDPESNDYYRPLDNEGMPVSTEGFRSWYGWGNDGRLLEAGGNRVDHDAPGVNLEPPRRSRTRACLQQCSCNALGVISRRLDILQPLPVALQGLIVDPS